MGRSPVREENFLQQQMLLKKKGLLHCEETQLWGVANEQQNTRINHHYSYTTDANISNHWFKFLREATENITTPQ